MIYSRSNFSSVIVGNYIYSIGGYQGIVEKAQINGNGSLGTWTETEPLSYSNNYENRISAVATKDYIYAISKNYNESNAGKPKIVERSKVNLDGTLGKWEIISYTTTDGYGKHTAVIVGNYIYIIGGENIPQLNSVERCKIQPDGSLGNWETSSLLIKSEYLYPTSVSLGGYIYTIGGEYYDSGQQDNYRSVERALVNPDGSLGSWEYVFSLSNKKNTYATQYDKYIYTIGGIAIGNDRFNDVVYSEITDGLMPMENGLSINNGDLFTFWFICFPPGHTPSC